eukprot:PhF_6_TR16936/c0_g1_i1/m.25486
MSTESQYFYAFPVVTRGLMLLLRQRDTEDTSKPLISRPFNVSWDIVDIVLQLLTHRQRVKMAVGWNRLHDISLSEAHEYECRYVATPPWSMNTTAPPKCTSQEKALEVSYLYFHSVDAPVEETLNNAMVQFPHAAHVSFAYNDKIKEHEIAEFLTKHGSQIRGVNLRNTYALFSDGGKVVLNHVAEHCPFLQEIHLETYANTRIFPETLTALTNLFTTRKNLVCVTFAISNGSPTNKDGFKKIMEALHSHSGNTLNSLCLFGLNVTWVEAAWIRDLFPNLHSLQLKGVSPITRPGHPEDVSLKVLRPSLSWIDLSNTKIMPLHMELIAKHGICLDRLQLRNCQSVTPKSLIELTKCCSNLSYLDVSMITALQNRDTIVAVLENTKSSLSFVSFASSHSFSNLSDEVVGRVLEAYKGMHSNKDDRKLRKFVVGFPLNTITCDFAQTLEILLMA